MKHLGIDYGEKRVGIAISDEDGQMAFPRKVIENNQKLIEELSQLIKEEKIEKIVIGDSKNYKLEDNEIMREVYDLKKVIESLYEIDVVLHNEILSSAEAVRTQGENKMLDASAATIILQRYLDLKKAKP